MPFVFGSCRASTSKQVMSTDVQMQHVKAWFDYQINLGEKLEWGGFFIDKATTSKIPWCERSYGALLNAQLQAGDIVVCAKLDRMFRNAREALNVIEDFRVREIRLVMLDMSVDTGTPNGKLFFTILAGFAEWERSRISERTREALAMRKATGVPHNKSVTMGWKRNRPRYQDSIKKLIPDYKAMEFGYAVIIMRDRHGVPVNDICLACHVIGKEKMVEPGLTKWEKAARAGYPRHDGQSPFRVPEAQAKVMQAAEVMADKLLAEVIRRNGFWAKRHLRGLPCRSTISP